MKSNKPVTAFVKVLPVVVLCMIVSGCVIVPTPRLTAEDRKADIRFLAEWARDYSPLVGLAEKHKGNPSYEALLPKYLDYAEQAESNEEFSQVVRGYYNLVCPAGHRSLIGETALRVGRLGVLLGIIDLGISPFTVEKARYWPRLSERHPDCAHPPFDILQKDGRYYTGSAWKRGDAAAPGGSHILWDDRMTCPA